MEALDDPLPSDDMSSTSSTAKWKTYVNTDVVLFISYGLLNNGVVCVVYGAAQDITNSFGYPDMAPSVVFWSTVSCILGPLLLLSWPLRKAGYRTRALVACALGLAGLLLLAISTQLFAAAENEQSPVGLFLGMVGVVLVALQQSIGENCACMRFRRFSKMALSCWGAGTGIAGIVPPLVYGLISHWPLYTRFLAVVPILPVYFIVCISVYNAGRRRDVTRSLIEDGVCIDVSDPSLSPPDQGARDVAERKQPADPEANVAATPPHEEIRTASSAYAWYIIGIFSAVYGLEYFIFPTLVDRATKCPATAAFGEQAYNTSWICYNIGVTLSRASIAFFQFPCLWVVFVLQAFNVAGWAFEVNTQSLARMGNAGYCLQYAWMVFVGLMGGTAYANCIRTFHCSSKVPSARRDQLINIAFAVSMAVILASTGLGELIDNTILTTENLMRHCPVPAGYS